MFTETGEVPRVSREHAPTRSQHKIKKKTAPDARRARGRGGGGGVYLYMLLAGERRRGEPAHAQSWVSR